MNWRKTPTDWAADTLHAAKVGAVFLVLLLALFVLPTTRLLFNPQSVQIVGDEVRLLRTFPGDAIGLSRPVLRYVETVQPITPGWNGGRFCTDFLSEAVQYNSSAPVGVWRIAWALPCLSDPMGYVWTARWYGYLGHLPLGPVSLTHVHLAKTEQP